MKKLLTAIVATLVMMACASHSTPSPQPPADPAYDVDCTVIDLVNHAPVEGASCTIGSQTVATNINGYGLLRAIKVGAITLLVHKEGYEDATLNQQIMGNTSMRVGLQPHTLPAITVNGLDFQTAGARWIWKGATDFALYKNWLDGKDMNAVLAQRKQAGANILRVFLNWGLIGFNPSNYGDRFFTELPNFARRVQQERMYVEFVVFAPKPLSPEFDGDVVAQMVFATKVYNALAGTTNIVFELGNEANLDNHLAIDAIPAPPPPWIWASGVYDVFGKAFRHGQFLTYHPRRDFPKAILDMAGVEARYGVNWPDLHWPVVPDEPARCPDHFTDPKAAWEMGRLAGSQNGGTIHTNNGRSSDLWDAVEVTCAEAFFAGVDGKERP